MKNNENFNFAIENQTAIITFTRPKLFNAMNRQMKLDLINTINNVSENKEIKSLILTGEGKAFSAGQDLNDRTVKAGEQGVDLGKTLKEEWNPLVESIRNCEKIVIAAINGVCAGAGVSVALSCDMLIAPPKTKFVSGFAQIGLAPDAGSSFILGRSLGHQKSLEFFLLGKPLFSESLLEKGLINQISESPLDTSKEFANQINKLPPLSVKEIKNNLKFAMNETYEKTLEREMKIQQFLGFSKDYKEGVQAFLEKREAKFIGE